MAWYDGLTDEQRQAACHAGGHACLLAGPGTGKTLTLCRRALYLAAERKVPPSEIVVITFTRAAAREIRTKIEDELNKHGIASPRVSTLHAFALRQLLRNAGVVDTLPKPLRIADDWEERHIILEDLKRVLNLDVHQVRDKLNSLSADWQTLDADKPNWRSSYPDPAFLGAWFQHRAIFGYTLRAELVYQLKKALEQVPVFNLEEPLSHVLVDEYQDLNPCDMAVVRALSAQGAQLFCAGDDDQSIYGFRFAYPQGIRQFKEDYKGAVVYPLQVCKRCGRTIVELSQFVANLDPKRLPKTLHPDRDCTTGEIQVLWFTNQQEEAVALALLCKHLIGGGLCQPKDIAILLRSDHQGVFSAPIREAMQRMGVPVATLTEAGPLDSEDGRRLLATLRLCDNERDHLAWRTLLQLARGIGDATVDSVYTFALSQGLLFADALAQICTAPDKVPRFGARIAQECHRIATKISECLRLVSGNDLLAGIEQVAAYLVTDLETRDVIVAYLKEIAEGASARSLTQFLSALSASIGEQEQETAPDSVNILTMHKAKGLDFDTVVIVAAEDEYIPGYNEAGDKEGDERRLFYVSLTRARDRLLATYCVQRTGQQKYTGRTSGTATRHLTRYLRSAPLKPRKGMDYVAALSSST